jgi:hypothetical protein
MKASALFADRVIAARKASIASAFCCLSNKAPPSRVSLSAAGYRVHRDGLTQVDDGGSWSRELEFRVQCTQFAGCFGESAQGAASGSRTDGQPLRKFRSFVAQSCGPARHPGLCRRLYINDQAPTYGE